MSHSTPGHVQINHVTSSSSRDFNVSLLKKPQLSVIEVLKKQSHKRKNWPMERKYCIVRHVEGQQNNDYINNTKLQRA